MAEALSIWTYDWVPQGPRGHVRDIRLRWACEEAGLAYDVKTVPFDQRGPAHFANQPFGQVPFLQDGEITVFESGACLLYLAGKSEILMPADAKGAAETLEWTIAGLNSIEMVSVPWWFIGITTGGADNPLEGWFEQRLKHLEAVLSERQWLAAGRFTVADILMADVLRVPRVVRASAALRSIRAYVERACARPAFRKAHADQMAHFARGDAGRAVG